MKYIYDNRGVALVTALLMVFVSLALIVGVLLLLNQGQKVSSLTRQYSTAREAAYGAAEFTAKEIVENEIRKGVVAPDANWLRTGTYGALVSHVTSESCFVAKLSKLKTQWAANCSASEINPAIDSLKAAPDFRVTLPGAASRAPFTVYVKIVDTSPGNTTSEDLIPDENAQFKSYIPYVYRVEFQAERTTNPDERAMLTGVMLY